MVTKLILLAFTAAQAAAPVGQSEIRIKPCAYHAVERYPHDRGAFTQGLAVSNGDLVESTGSWGDSTIRRVEVETGRVVNLRTIKDDVFGEGATVLAGRIYSLTWKSGLGYVWDEKSLEPIGTFSYVGEGWGLTNDGRSLILSDGSNLLRFIDPQTMNVSRTLSVTYDGKAVERINELEWVNDRILANIWQSERIAVISAETGAVEEWIDFTGLRDISETDASPDSVLNGIAYDEETDHLYVTGKNWPWLYLVIPSENCRFKTKKG